MRGLDNGSSGLKRTSQITDPPSYPCILLVSPSFSSQFPHTKTAGELSNDGILYRTPGGDVTYSFITQPGIGTQKETDISPDNKIISYPASTPMNGPYITLDTKTRSRIFYTLYGAVFSTMLGVGIVIPLLPRYAATMGATGIWIGMIFSAFALSRLIFLPIFGRLSDSHGRRHLIITGLAAYTILSILYVLAHTVAEITALRFLHGIASAMVLPIALAYINECAPHRQEGKFVSSFASSIYLGMGFGPLLGGIIADLFPTPTVFLCMAGFSLLALIMSLVALPEISPKKAVRPSIKAVILHRSLHGPVLYQLMYALANGTFMVFLPVLAIMNMAISSTQVGMIILVSVLTTPIFQHFFSRVSDQFARYRLITIGVGMVGVSLLIVPVIHSFAAYLAAALIMGIGRGISLPAMFAQVTIAGREIGQGSASGIVHMSQAVGLIIAPLLSGAVMDIAGISMVFYNAGMISILCMVIFLRIAGNE
jgi:MFS transporter, DHA1 family, multidrug resistance protein